MRDPKLAATAPPRQHRRRAEGPFLGALLVALMAGALWLSGCGGGDPGAWHAAAEQAEVDAALEVVIPPGAGRRIAAGEDLTLLPAQVTLRVGDVFRIVNRDDRTHVVGPFSVQAGETLTQRFTSTGSYRGRCSVHPSGDVVIEVVP